MTAHVAPNVLEVTKHKEEEMLAGTKWVVGPINWSLICRRNKEVLGRTNRLLSFDTTCTAQKTTRPTIFEIVAYVFIIAVTFLLSRYLQHTNTDTQTDGRHL
jgi:hypothetical protein